MAEQNLRHLSSVSESDLMKAYPDEYEIVSKKIKAGKSCWIMSIVITIVAIVLGTIGEIGGNIGVMLVYILLYILAMILAPVGIVKHIIGVVRMNNLRKRAIAEGKA